MYFLETTDNNHYIRIFDQIVTDGMFRGVMTNSHIACVNPAIYPSIEAMRYIWKLEQIRDGPNVTENERVNILIQNLEVLNINWLTNSFEYGVAVPEVNEAFYNLKQLDIDNFILAVNTLAGNNSLEESELQDNIYLQRYFTDQSLNYQSQLLQYKWHAKRFDFFKNANFKCSRCINVATIKMISEVAMNNSSSISFSYNSFQGGNKRKIDKAIATLNSFTLPLLKLNWTFLQHPNVAEEVILQLHHKYYINDGRKAWEYDDDCFQVLCRKCHEHIHETEDIPVFDSEEDKNNNSPNQPLCPEICCRCEGLGYIEAFRHVQNGICFQCWGEGFSFKNSV